MNLASIYGFKADLDSLDGTQNPIVSISERHITLMGNHYVYKTGYSSKVQLEDDWEVLNSESVPYTNL